MDTITTQAMDTKFIYMHVYSHVNHKYKLEMEANQAINIPTTLAIWTLDTLCNHTGHGR